MTNVTRALLIGVTVGVIAGAGATGVYYRGIPGKPPTPVPAPSAPALRPKLLLMTLVDFV